MSVDILTPQMAPAIAASVPAQTSAVSGYVPVLDGLRAISIGLVLVSHLLIFDPHPDWVYRLGLACGATGVSVFFVISGYLITSLLLREEDRSGRIDLKNFYARRFLRIFPAAYAFLAVILVLKLAGVIEVNRHSYLASLFYIRNLIGSGHETGHLWSLSIEEQFYLIWPGLLLLLPAGKRLKAVTGIVLAVCAWRSYLVIGGKLSEGQAYNRTDLRIDTILMGCILAFLVRTEYFSRWNRSWLRHPLVAVGSLVALALTKWFAPGIAHADSLESTISAVFMGLLVNWFLQNEFTRIARVFQISAVLFIGKISYGIYLWQQLFLGPREGGMSVLRGFPIGLALTFVVACASFFLLERPALRLKARYAAR